MPSVNPWAELRSRTELTLAWEYLPAGIDGLYCPHGDGTATIVLHAELGRADRNAVLTHELEHHRRGITGDRRLDERGVDDEVARRLVPLEEMEALYEIATTNELPVEPWMIAEKFDVPDDVARRAMSLFLDQTRCA